jgi:hypothetical protein
MKSTGRKTVKAARTSAPKAIRSARTALVAGPTVEEIARRSYEIFLARGGEHGHDMEDWLQAEDELRNGG